MFDSDFGYVKEDKVFRKGFRSFPDKQIGEVKKDEATSVAYFKDRFIQAEQKVGGLEKAVEAAENKGSYLMRLIHLKDQLASFDAIGDFEALFVRLEKLEEQLKEIITANRANNLIIKKGLIAEAELLRGSTNWKEDTEKFKDLKGRWIKTGNVEKEFEEDLNIQFSSIVDTFFNKRQEYFREKHRETKNKLAQLRRIVEKAKKVLYKPPAEAKNELKALQEEWKSVGKVPNNLAKALYKEFSTISNKVFKPQPPKGFNLGKVEEHIPYVLKQKERLVAKAKELSLLQSPTESNVKEAQALQKEWKKTGILPREQNKALAKVFYVACNLVLEKHFVINLAIRKHKDFLERNAEEQLRIKIQLTHDLLARDQMELKTFQENLEKVNSSTDGVNKMVNAKFNQQVRKVFVKECMLEEYESELKKIK